MLGEFAGGAISVAEQRQDVAANRIGQGDKYVQAPISDIAE